jgi:hypothetical protein
LTGRTFTRGVVQRKGLSLKLRTLLLKRRQSATGDCRPFGASDRDSNRESFPANATPYLAVPDQAQPRLRRALPGPVVPQHPNLALETAAPKNGRILWESFPVSKPYPALPGLARSFLAQPCPATSNQALPCPALETAPPKGSRIPKNLSPNRTEPGPAAPDPAKPRYIPPYLAPPRPAQPRRGMPPTDPSANR